MATKDGKAWLKERYGDKGPQRLAHILKQLDS